MDRLLAYVEPLDNLGGLGIRRPATQDDPIQNVVEIREGMIVINEFASFKNAVALEVVATNTVIGHVFFRRLGSRGASESKSLWSMFGYSVFDSIGDAMKRKNAATLADRMRLPRRRLEL